jgi:hypothetical protein
MECFFEKIDSTPLLEQIEALYEPAKERLREANYRQDQLIHQLHLQAMKPPEQAVPEVAVAD